MDKWRVRARTHARVARAQRAACIQRAKAKGSIGSDPPPLPQQLQRASPAGHARGPADTYTHMHAHNLHAHAHSHVPTSVHEQAGADWSVLRDLLAAGEFQKADDETRAKLIEIAGEDAIKRGWVYFSEVRARLTAPSPASCAAMHRDARAPLAPRCTADAHPRRRPRRTVLHAFASRRWSTHAATKMSRLTPDRCSSFLRGGPAHDGR